MLYVWSMFVRVSHWLLAAAFAVAWLTHGSMWYANLHAQAGYVAGGVMLGRIAWGLLAHGYCSFARFPFRPGAGMSYAWDALTGRARRYIGHNPAGSVVIYAMLAVGLSTVGSGMLVLNSAYLPDAVPDFSGMHGVLAWLWLGLVVTHVSGVVAESWLTRENLIATMITGYKQRHAPPRRLRHRQLLRVYARLHLFARRLRHPADGSTSA